MKKAVSILLLACMGSLVSLSAAEITTPKPKKCEAFRPDVLYAPMLLEKDALALAASSDFGQRSSKRGEGGHDFWIVYSDRDNNPTYIAPGSQTVYRKLDFNQKVRIAQIKDRWALVYDEPKEQEAYPRFSSEMQWLGWIEMDKLLLWSVCPSNEAGIYGKAMLCANLDEEMDNDRLGKRYLNPQDMAHFASARIDFTYYFVMKTEGDMALLAHQNMLTGQTYRGVLYGWVDKNSYVAWNQRSCLEPTWDIDNVEYFARNGVKVNIYSDASMKTKASFLTFSKKKDAAYDPYMYRMSGEELRYPILDDNTDKVWNCSTFSSPGGGAINQTSERQAIGRQAVRRNMEALSRINIAIVIDGTKSMEKFFPAVRETILQVTDYFSADMKVKVGVLIYRDKYDDAYVTEMVPMTDPQNPKLSEFLNKGGSYGIRSGAKDKTMEEALYYGMNQALDSFGFQPDESNIMFVIGDCGDAGDYPEITDELLVSKLVEKNVNLMGFQVRNNPADPAFPLFTDNLCDLIEASMQRRFAQLSEEVHVRAVPKRNEYEFTNNAKNAEGDLFIGSHSYVQNGVMDIKDLQDKMTHSVLYLKQTVDHQMAELSDAYNGVQQTVPSSFQGSTEVTGPQLDQEWLKNRLGKDMYNALRASNTTVSFRGYTPKAHASEHEYYKTVIFISQQELNALMTKLAPLYEVAQRKGNDREPYVKAMRALIQGMIPNISDAEMNAKGYDEVMAMAAGLNASTITVKGRTIMEVASTQAVNAAEYQSLIAKFKRQYQKLQRIQRTPYRFVREFNGAKYYWIPTEDLP